MNALEASVPVGGMMEELARRLAGDNAGAGVLAYSCGEENRLGPVQYFPLGTKDRPGLQLFKRYAIFLISQGGVKGLTGVREIWVGCQRDWESELNILLQEWGKSKEFDQITCVNNAATVHRLIFK